MIFCKKISRDFDGQTKFDFCSWQVQNLSYQKHAKCIWQVSFVNKGYVVLIHYMAVLSESKYDFIIFFLIST